MITRDLRVRKSDAGHSLIQIETEHRGGFLRLVRYTCQCGTRIGSTRGDQDGVSRRFVNHQKEGKS